MSESKRKLFSGSQKAKLALAALKGDKTINELSQESGVHPTQINQWKKELQDRAVELFENKRGPKPVDEQSDPEKLYAKIGQLNVELDWLKKKSGISP
jgi:transposase